MEIPLNKLSENIKILLKLEKKNVQKRNGTRGVLKDTNLSVILKIKDFIPRRDSAEQSPKGVQLFLFDGMGWDGMGWGETGYQKCPSMFFILFRYIEDVYIYLCIYTQKFSPILLRVSNFDFLS